MKNKMVKKKTTKNTNAITYLLSQSCIVKYLVVVVDRCLVSEFNHLNSLEEVKSPQEGRYWRSKRCL